MCCNWDRTQEDSGSVFPYACVEKDNGVTDFVCFHVLPRDMLWFPHCLHFANDKMSWGYCDCFYQKEDTGVAWLKVWLQVSKWKTAGKARHREPVHPAILGTTGPSKTLCWRVLWLEHHHMQHCPNPALPSFPKYNLTRDLPAAALAHCWGLSEEQEIWLQVHVAWGMHGISCIN